MARTRKLTSWDRQSLYNHAQSTPIWERWSKGCNISHHLIRSIDWEACEHPIQLLGLICSLWMPKWLAGFAPVGKVQQRNMFQDHAKCPRCSAFETTARTPLPGPPRSMPVGLILVHSRPMVCESPSATRSSKRDHHLPPLVTKPRWRPPPTTGQASSTSSLIRMLLDDGLS
jgi:hypothetical protein